MDGAADVPAHVEALEAFDAIPELQELKTLGRERGGIAPGRSVPDVGCGFGLETLREALPYADANFDCVRAERLLIYLADPAKAVAEMKRVARSGGR